MFLADARTEFRIVEQEIGEFGALLDEIPTISLRT
jgi:hypothetical protein